MTDRNPSWDELLLDLHLHRLEPEKALDVENAVRHSPELAARSQALRTLLQLLDADDAPAPPADLADRVLTRIHTPDPVIPFPTPAPAGPQRTAPSPRVGLRDLLAAAACLVLFFAVAVPGYQKTRQVSMRSRCLDQLRQVSAAANAYSRANAGFLPYDGYVPGASWLPTGQPKPPFASNTRHIFRIVTQGYVPDLRVFVCPADRAARPLTPDQARRLADFPGRSANSYSFLFMNTPRGLRLVELPHGLPAQIVLMADAHPLQPAPDAPLTPPVRIEPANSPLHEHGAGQNAVYADGHGGFFRQPTIGVDRDDIYRVGDLKQYTGTENPLAQTDTFLPP